MKNIRTNLPIVLLSDFIQMILLNGGNFTKGVNLPNKKIMIRRIVCRNLEFKVKIIMNWLQKINLLICQNTSQKEKINIPSKIITIVTKNTKTTINSMKHGKITLKIVNREGRKEAKNLLINKREKNQKMGIKTKSYDQSQ